ncbi:4-(cytidine 5'-diphospho)-2-C-methyl-D-erythritol kinase [Campylobacter sp. 19-13652]|uniref:4-(cytidine 5'-diphospho)-2-C-methyl-D-erythritol kinase n=1 Tax=Campylobacter sp. 19-13652 TaxID=2840180 RepID=UPI001C774BC0|nr:4-(cytidine 5'-diphospho)-2-C-methyl-D-erythritol kinase [Campylobacter sp. 19-13652]BCX79336.1 4-diphosphocytidyl-2-C-methyl-D-erythritol kinase [Campylobacter sp. 19-13652]
MKAPAKINIFLKITGTRGVYHEILSRFVRFEDLSDELTLVPRVDERLVISDFNDTIIAKAYDIMAKAGYAGELAEIFRDKSVRLTKRIPVGAGLGGGSSDAACFMLLVNEFLGLSADELLRLGLKVGADVPFFLSGQSSANVSGIGEIIEPFDDDLPALLLVSPDVFCSTPEVYAYFRANLLSKIEPKKAKDMVNLKSDELLVEFKNSELNDLRAACLALYSELNKPLYLDKFLSGSGSSLFWLKE